MNYPGPKNCYKCGASFEIVETGGDEGLKITHREIPVVITVGEGKHRHEPGDYGFCVDCFIEAFMGESGNAKVSPPIEPDPDLISYVISPY